MDTNHILVILAGLDKQIEEHKKKIEELEEARKAFVRQHESVLLSGKGTEQPTPSKPSTRRLPAGIPRRWVLEALATRSGITISEMNDIVEQKHGKRLADGTIRRAVDQLKDEKKVFYNEEDGTWALLVTQKLGGAEDDDLPF